MSQPGMIDFFDDEPVRVTIPNATSAPVAGWSGELSRGQGFWDFELVAADTAEPRIHGFVTDRSELAIACVHGGGRSRIVALEPPAAPDGVDDEPGYAAWIAGVLSRAVDATDDGPTPAESPTMELLPPGNEWDAQFVVQPAAGETYPTPDAARSFLEEGGEALAAREQGEAVRFWFDAQGRDDPEGLRNYEASGPWLFEAWPDGTEARVVLGFFGGGWGPEEVFGWAAWTDDAVWFVAYDASNGASSIAKTASPLELRERTPADPAWWLALARLLVVIQPLAVEHPLYEQR